MWPCSNTQPPLHVSYMPRPGPISDGFGVEAFGVVTSYSTTYVASYAQLEGRGRTRTGDGSWRIYSA